MDGSEDGMEEVPSDTLRLFTRQGGPRRTHTELRRTADLLQNALCSLSLHSPAVSARGTRRRAVTTTALEDNCASQASENGIGIQHLSCLSQLGLNDPGSRSHSQGGGAVAVANLDVEDLFETLSQCSQSDSDGEHDFYGIYETTEQQNFQSPPISARLPARMSRSPLFLDHAAPAHTASPATPQGPTPSVRQESSDSDWRPADTVFAGRRASESPTVVSGGCAQWSPARTAQSSHASTPGSGPSAGSNAQPRARSRLQLLSRSHSQYTPTRPGNMVFERGPRRAHVSESGEPMLHADYSHATSPAVRSGPSASVLPGPRARSGATHYDPVLTDNVMHIMRMLQQ